MRTGATGLAGLWILSAGVIALGASACGDDGGPTQTTDTTATDTGHDTDTGDDTVDTDVVTPPEGRKCDPLDPSFCSFPWPSNLYMEADANTTTGYRLAFGDGLPLNNDGKPIDPTPYGRLDGFGPNSPLLVRFGEIDLTGMAKEYSTDPSLAADAPILWFEVTDDGLERVPCWVDVDLPEKDPAQRVLVVRPAVILKEATRYIVAFRDLSRPDGAPIPASAAFAALRDGTAATDPALAPRVAGFEDVFARLSAASVDRSELVLAWDFVTASSEALHGRMLRIRDEAFATVGADGPELGDLVVEDLEHEHWAFEVRGTFRVPNYMVPKDSIVGDFDVFGFMDDEAGQPVQVGWDTPDFIVRVPKSALDGTPHGLVLYGHGQNGLASQVRGGFNGKIAFDHQLIFFACDLQGMAEYDVPGILSFLSDLSGFVNMADRLHQGVLNHLLLTRAIRRRLGGLDAITSRGVVVAADQVYYSGISQGGIYGPTIVALSPDITRGHFGVPGNTYSYLLMRSRNFAPFLFGLNNGYDTRVRVVTAVNAIQLLWDSVDSGTYIPHFHDPLPGSPVSVGLWAPAKGDPQVAVTSNEAMTRSGIGIGVLEHYDLDRNVTGADVVSYPHTGSGVVLYDFGDPWPEESVQQPPPAPEVDPHALPRRSDPHNAQMVHFFKTGEIIDVCGGDGCHPD